MAEVQFLVLGYPASTLTDTTILSVVFNFVYSIFTLLVFRLSYTNKKKFCYINKVMTRLKHKEAIHEKLSALKLPQLPQVLIQLIDVCRAEEVDIRLVAQTVAQDITITTKTLQLANSAFLGARSQFKNIDQAVIFLGVDTVRNLAISVSVHNVFGNDAEAHNDHLDSEKFWYHSLLTALISKTVAEKSGYDAPGTAYLMLYSL
jgi:HD-like signal output (HDOD) protein